jgi:(1->4)-alpha-D-glucan 1-alpha-D-glucosylmutase
VGGDPSEFAFPPARFHRASSHRARHWPHTMLATSTHDNKRSEDVRARIDVISEKVPEWRLQLRKWSRMNAGRKADVDGQPAPSKNDEYLLYQTLLGSFDPKGSLPEYTDRIVAYMEKATREAKQRTSWANPNEEYEAATTAFVRGLLEHHAGNTFLEDLRASVAPVAWIGFLNGLSMATVKFTSPGVPDIYQGNETWDFSLVDPDNRRPVDYERRRRMLAELEGLPNGAGLDASLSAMLENIQDGRAKLYVAWRLLHLRKAKESLFLHGGYTAVHPSGSRARHVIAFARRHGGESAITVAPRLIGGLELRPGDLPCGDGVWRDTRLALPFFKDGTVLHDVLSGRTHTVDQGGLMIGSVLAMFPTAVLSL